VTNSLDDGIALVAMAIIDAWDASSELGIQKDLRAEI
jgi:hypothetical protein